MSWITLHYTALHCTTRHCIRIGVLHALSFVFALPNVVGISCSRRCLWFAVDASVSVAAKRNKFRFCRSGMGMEYGWEYMCVWLGMCRLASWCTSSFSGRASFCYASIRLQLNLGNAPERERERTEQNRTRSKGET